MKEPKLDQRPVWFPRLLSSASLTAHRSDSHPWEFSCRSHPHRGILKLWCGDSILLGAVGTSFWTWAFLRAGSFQFRLGGCVYLWAVRAKFSLPSRAHAIIPSAREARQEDLFWGQPWSMTRVPEQPGLHKEAFTPTNKQNKIKRKLKTTT